MKRKLIWLLSFSIALYAGNALGATFTSDTLIDVGDTSYDGQDIIVDGCILTVNGQHTFNNLQVLNGGVLTHSASGAGLNLTFTGDLIVDAGSSISANGKGYGGDSGPGAGGGGSGGSYGGVGGWNTAESVYGSVTTPLDLGSGGGHGYGAAGGSGGGAIRLTVGGMLIIDGSLTANGDDGVHCCTLQCTFHYYGGGGSGGSIYAAARELAGDGIISVDGGDGGRYGSSYGASGGGGGRIAIYYDSSTYTGSFSANGGTGYQAGGAGTIYTKSAAQSYGELLIDNNSYAGASTPLNESITLDNLAIRNAAKLILTTGTTTTIPIATLSGAALDIASGAILNTQNLMLESSSALTLDSGGNLNLPNLSLSSSMITNNGNLNWATVALTGTNVITNNGHLSVPTLTVVNLTLYQKGMLNIADNSLTVDANGVFVLDVPLEIGSVTLNSGGILTHSAGDTSLDVSVTGDLTVNTGGVITANGKGYGSDSGPGAGVSGAGGSYGGVGGWNTAESVYGSVTTPLDLGSGGGHGYGAAGGSGGGAIRLTVGGMLIIDGSLTANGDDGVHCCTLQCTFHYYGGGGSGGSIYAAARELAGDGIISVDGGDGGRYGSSYGASGGGGGRIAIYYDTNTYTGTISANGGAGYQAGEEGSIAINPGSIVNLEELSSSQSVLIENVVSQQATLTTVEVAGDLIGTIDFTDFEMVSVNTGSFTGKGFSKGQWQANLEGLPYTGDWKGFSFLVPSERRVYLKGVISGEISAIVEGYLAESVPGSGVYDQCQVTWKVARLGTETVSATINLAGTVNYQESTEYPSTELYILQTSVEGNTIGNYTGSLSTVLTHLRIAAQNNPYYGEGFSIISYVSEIGQGEAWAYNNLTSLNISQLSGFLTSPIEGILSGTLDETTSPRTLALSVERIDLGLPPAPDLKVRTWGPTRVSPGQTINYIIEYRNDGLKAGEDVFIVKQLSPLVEFIGASNGFYYSPISHEVSWNLVSIPAKTTSLLSVQVYVPWGLPWGTLIGDPTYIGQAKKFKNVYLPGINWGDKDLPRIADLAREFGARYTLTYKDTGLVDSILEVWMAWCHIGTDKNGLKWDWGNAHYDVAIAYSGGTRTLISLIQEGRITVDTVILVSPQLISQQELEDIINGNVAGVKQIIVYQSDADYCIPIVINPLLGTPLEKILYVGRDRDTGDFFHSATGIEAPAPWHGVQHENMDNYLKELLVGGQLDWAQPPVPDNVSEFASTVAVARDPSIKYGPEGRVSPGQQLDYKVEYENEGEGIAFGVYFTDTLDEDLNDLTLEIGPVIDVNDGSIIAGPGIYNPATRTITWFAGEVGPGQGGYTDFSVNVRADAEDGTEIINFATIYFPSVPEETRTNGIVSIVSLNQPPIANAGNNIQIPSSDQGNTTIQVITTDPEGDPLEYRWLEGNDVLLGWTAVGENGEACLDLGTLPYLSVGNHTLILEVREAKEGGLVASDEMILTVQNSPPQAQPAPSYQVVEIGIDPIVVIADVADSDGDMVTYQLLKGSEVLASGSVQTTQGGASVQIPDLVIQAGDERFPVGLHQIELKVSDGINEPVSAFVSVEVTDTTTPTLAPVPSVTILWPPNHKLQAVTIAANAFDNGGGTITLGVTVQSSEPPDTAGDGSTIPDYYIDSVDNETGIIQLRLRSERAGTGDGRTYKITITATDVSGNSSVAIVEIRALHDKRKK